MAKKRRTAKTRSRSSLRGRKLARSVQMERSFMGGRRAKSRKTHGNPVRVPAAMSGKSTGWMKAKGVRVRKSGRGFVVDVKR